MKNISEERENVRTLINLFSAINKLNKMYTLDQAIDVLDIYFKTGDSTCITSEDGIREFVVNSHIREKLLPSLENYNHLAELIDEIYPNETKTK